METRDDSRRLSILLGLFLFLSPWFFAYAQSISKVDAWASGLAIALISIAAILAFSDWEEWLNLLLGLWLMLAPWILGITHTPAYVSIGVGIAITYIALLDIWCIHYSIDTPPTESNEFTGDR
jgi:SPW repeat